MSSTNHAQQESVFTLTRDEATALYKFLRERTECDALRYELIAKKIHRVVEGYANTHDQLVARDWYEAWAEEEAAKLARHQLSMRPYEKEPFADVRLGRVGNPNYQAFLDTLEQEELDQIHNNIPFFSFFMQREIEAARLGRRDLASYIREWADANLSERVKALRAQH